jgi:L-seryl-tRNA(Ser) seleniumtransferase
VKSPTQSSRSSEEPDSGQTAALRDLPSVDGLLTRFSPIFPDVPRAVVAGEVRRVLETVRAEIRQGRQTSPAEPRIRQALTALQQPSLRPVINATGVVLHTNLGRAPLPPMKPIAGYSNLEYDLATGHRGKRDTHLTGLMERLFGAPGIVVNNNAAAIFLALHELAAGKEAIVSRGELIEIGDGFRIPDIMASSGARLREVGATNRTRLLDYRAAIGPETALLLRVHPSNFHIVGFTGKPNISELAALAREKGVLLYEDLGSGCVADLRAYGIYEPLVSESLRAGVDLVSFSGDKLLGGAQAGFLTGRPDVIARLRRNPMFRALRVDKIVYQMLESTLRNLLLERWDAVPVLAMIGETAETIRVRALRFRERITAAPVELIQGRSVIGGGSTPGQSLPTWLIALGPGPVVEWEAALRRQDPPVIARIEEERLLLDLRTVFPEDEEALLAAVQALS